VLWVFDVTLGHTYVSPSVFRLRGFTVEEAMKQGIGEILTPESHARVMSSSGGSDGWRCRGSATDQTGPSPPSRDETQGRLHGLGGGHGSTSSTTGREDQGDNGDQPRHLRAEAGQGGAEKEPGCPGGAGEGAHPDLTRANEQLEKENEERRLAEKRLLENDERYPMYFSLSDDVMFSWDNQFTITNISPNVERVLGYTQEELVGRRFDELSILEPGDMQEAMDNALSLLSGKKVYSSLYRFITKDGERKFGDLSEVPIIRQGRIMGMITVGRDMTKSIEMEDSLQKSEERYRATLQVMPDAVSIIRTEDSKYLYVNDAFCRITGHGARAVREKTPFELDLPATADDLELLTGVIRGSEPGESLEVRIKSRDGRVIDMLMAARPVHFSGEECLVMVMTDLTAMKLVEQERNHLALKARKMEYLGTLSTGFAHDFNNLLTTISGYTRMSIREIQEPAGGQTDPVALLNHLAEVRTAADRARDLVNQVIDFSSAADKVFAPIDLSSTVHDSLNLRRPSLKKTVRVAEELPGTHMVMGDAGQIHQVMKNLCSNAVYSMSSQGGVLEVSLDDLVVDDPASLNLDVARGAYVRLVVRDTGQGMSSRVRDRIFDPYFTTKGVSLGRGMGLSIVQGIVKSHGGTVTCDSEPGRGACFSIYLPLMVPGKPDQPGPGGRGTLPGDAKVLDLDAQ
jgi:PAS domain S-box-containing protein